MATWNLSPQYKKSAVEKMFFYKDSKCITIEQGFRWANFKVESDERPLTDSELVNEDGYELSCIENDECWEMWDMTDGCWLDIEAARDNTTKEDVAEFEAAWEEDSYEGVEAIGWSQDDTEYYYYGPLMLTNEDTGEEFLGEPEEDVSVGGVPVSSPEVMQQAITELKDTLDQLAEDIGGIDEDPQADCPHCHWEGPMGEVKFIDGKFYCPSCEKPFGTREERDAMLAEKEPELTEWYPASINPVRKGTYQVLGQEEEVSWPFPSNIIAGTWDGKKWDVSVSMNVVKWRGLSKESK